MTKEELTIKWKKELQHTHIQIETAKRNQREVSVKLTTRRKVILSMLEDIKQLNEEVRIVH